MGRGFQFVLHFGCEDVKLKDIETTWQFKETIRGRQVEVGQYPALVRESSTPASGLMPRQKCVGSSSFVN